jgi:hypothetical protein
MRKKTTQVLWSLLMLYIFFFQVSADEYQKLAQTGFQFLSVVSDARAAAIGEAVTSLQVGSSALFFNPAGMSDFDGILDVTISNNRWIADITHNTLGMAYNAGNIGVFGFSLQSVDYGEFYGTRVSRVDKGYEDTEIFKLSSLAIGVGYARSLTERFSVGGQARWVRQDLGESEIPRFVTVPATEEGEEATTDTLRQTVSNKLEPFAFDFGTQFKTGFKSLVFGMSVRNFSEEIKYVDEGFQLPLVFNLGISMDVMDFIEQSGPMDHSVYVSIDASHYRSHAEQIKIGLDYRIQNVLSLRSGYISNNDESGISFGLGVTYSKVSFDYAYTPFGLLGTVQRMTARFSL